MNTDSPQLSTVCLTRTSEKSYKGLRKNVLYDTSLHLTTVTPPLVVTFAILGAWQPAHIYYQMVAVPPDVTGLQFVAFLLVSDKNSIVEAEFA